MGFQTEEGRTYDRPDFNFVPGVKKFAKKIGYKPADDWNQEAERERFNALVTEWEKTQPFGLALAKRLRQQSTLLSGRTESVRAPSMLG